MTRSHRFSLRALVAVVALGTLAADTANASFISISPDPILGGSLVSTAPIATQFGNVTFTIANVTETDNIVNGGDNFITYTASPFLTIFDPITNAVTATVTLQGQFEVQIFGRKNPFETGTFDFQFVSSTVTGTFEGLPVTVRLDPNQPSVGTTTITAGPGVGQYTIDTTDTQYSQFSLGGRPFVGIPPIGLAGVSAVPEPASLTMLGTALAGVGLIFIRRRRAV